MAAMERTLPDMEWTVPVMECLEDRLLLASGGSAETLAVGPAGATAIGIVLHNITSNVFKDSQADPPNNPIVTDPPPPPVVDTGIGQGATNAFYIDRDGDGYGVGSPLGPDADDKDPAVNTFQSALAKYGSVQALLNHLGYYPLRIFYISPAGNDAAGAVDEINKPFRNYTAVVKQLRPGDAVIFREGTYVATSDAHMILVSNLHGTAENPITIMGMPGEKVVLDTARYDIASIYVTQSSYINFDNFVATTSTSPGQGRGININFSHHLNFRNIETKNHCWGIIGMQDLHYLLFDNIVAHNNTGEHGIYLGAREYPNSNITIQNSLFYYNNWQGIQINGRGDNYVIANNIIHSNGQIGIQLIQGVCNSTISNNLIFNNAKSPIVFYMYDSTDPNIAPYRQENNLVINNTIWTGPDSNRGNNPENAASVLFSDTTAKGNFSMNNNIFRNNIFYSYGGEIFRVNSSNALGTMVIENNIFYRVLGDSKVISLQGTNYSMSAFPSLSPLFRNNLYADPMFVDVNRTYHTNPEKFSFKLQSTSPAINAGLNTAAPAYDLRYKPRVGRVDIGAYEYIV